MDLLSPQIAAALTSGNICQHLRLLALPPEISWAYCKHTRSSHACSTQCSWHSYLRYVGLVANILEALMHSAHNALGTTHLQQRSVALPMAPSATSWLHTLDMIYSQAFIQSSYFHNKFQCLLPNQIRQPIEPSHTLQHLAFLLTCLPFPPYAVREYWQQTIQVIASPTITQAVLSNCSHYIPNIIQSRGEHPVDCAWRMVCPCHHAQGLLL
jgi:hypothetical protein